MAPSEQIALGFGCFHFGLNGSTPWPLTGGEYLAELERALAEVDGVHDVAITAPPDFVDSILEPQHDRIAVDRGGWAYPDIEWAEITMVLDLPAVDILGGDTGGRTALFLRRAWASPLAMVMPLESSLLEDPSRAVALARIHLEAAFQEIGSTFLDFECLGPSPAHVDVYLSAEAGCDGDPDSEFALRRYGCPSYHRYELAFDPSRFDSSMDVALTYFEEATAPLDSHYECAAIRARHIWAWNALANNIERIKAMQGERGLASTYRRLVRQRQPMNQAAVDLADLELDFLMATNGVESRDVFSPGRPAHLKELVEGARKELVPLPTGQFQRLISLFDHRRVTDRDLLATLIFGLLAAAVGAAATLLASA